MRHLSIWDMMCWASSRWCTESTARGLTRLHGPWYWRWVQGTWLNPPLLLAVCRSGGPDGGRCWGWVHFKSIGASVGSWQSWSPQRMRWEGEIFWGIQVLQQTGLSILPVSAGKGRGYRRSAEEDGFTLYLAIIDEKFVFNPHRTFKQTWGTEKREHKVLLAIAATAISQKKTRSLIFLFCLSLVFLLRWSFLELM